MKERKGRGEEREGRQRRNIWKKSSLTVQLFATHCTSSSYMAEEGGREGEKKRGGRGKK